MTIRPATPNDCDLLLDLIRGLADYERLADQVSATPKSLREALFGARPIAEALIAEENGVAVGYCLFFTTFSTFLAQPGIWIEDLFVLPEHRGRGTGTALLTAVARIAVERDCGRLEWAVLDWNQPAIDLYRKLGADPLDDWTTYRLTGQALHRLAGDGQSQVSIP